jgi:hypothetical protein
MRLAGWLWPFYNSIELALNDYAATCCANGYGKGLLSPQPPSRHALGIDGFITEFGIGLHGAACDATEMIEMLKWMDTHEAGYMAFSWNAGGQECGSLALIRDHNGTPHAPNGTAYKDYLAQILGAA